MLVLSRRIGESIQIRDDIVVTLIDIRRDKVRLAVTAPPEMPVHRQEVYDAILGHRAASLDPGWLTWRDGVVVRLAQAIAEKREFEALPLLADALEEAGCANAAILGHCRSGGPGTGNSWVVELILSAS